jgi:hypothetical protein
MGAEEFSPGEMAKVEREYPNVSEARKAYLIRAQRILDSFARVFDQNRAVGDEEGIAKQSKILDQLAERIRPGQSVLEAVADELESQDR